MSEEICEWKYDKDDDWWDTGCGEAFFVLEGTPKDNRMKYCPYCGKIIKEQT